MVKSTTTPHGCFARLTAVCRLSLSKVVLLCVNSRGRHHTSRKDRLPPSFACEPNSETDPTRKCQMNVVTMDETIFVMMFGSVKETKTKLFANTAGRWSATSKMRSYLARQQPEKLRSQQVLRGKMLQKEVTSPKTSESRRNKTHREYGAKQRLG